MNKEFLSIGEMAKLKGIGIKALRYYEKIGLLLPAYVNEQTGYRYYTLNQSAEIDIIITCIYLGIPLKEVMKFKLTDGSLDMKNLLEFGKITADEKLKHLQMKQHQLTSYIKGMNERSHLPQEIAGTKFLVQELDNSRLGIHAYIKTIASLYEKAENLGLVSLYLEGVIYVPEHKKVMCAVEVESTCHANLKPNDTFIYPKGKYERKIYKNNSLEACFRDVILNAKAGNKRGLTGAFPVWQDTHKRNVSVVDVIQLAETANNHASSAC